MEIRVGTNRCPSAQTVRMTMKRYNKRLGMNYYDTCKKDESQPTRRSTALAGFQGNVDLGALSTMMPLIEYPEDEEEEGLIENDNDKENEKKATQNPALEHNVIITKFSYIKRHKYVFIYIYVYIW